MNFVDLDRVSLRYGEDDSGTLALHGTTLHVGQGEFVAVVGPSGCGKSTLMKVVTGLWPATAGAVLVSGREVTAPLSIAGMAFQNPTLLPWRTTLANVMLPLEIVQPHCRRLRHERAAYEAKARDLLALVGLKGFEDHFLDMFTREELWLALQDLWLARKPTVILITHDLREAAFLADRVLVMSARPGRIIAERAVELPRPRKLDMTYAPYSVELVHALRERISAARLNPT